MHRHRYKNKIKAQPLNPPRIIPRPPSHHALKRVQDAKTRRKNAADEKQQITLTHATLKGSGINREETFYNSFSKIPSAEPQRATEAPPEMQLELPDDQTFISLSRASTSLSATKIRIDIASARNRSDQQTNRNVNTSKSTVESKRKQIRTHSNGAVKRKSVQVAVKSLKNTAYLKKTNVLKGVKLNSKAFKQNVKLVGRLTKKKKIQRKPQNLTKINEEQNSKTETHAIDKITETKHEHVDDNWNESQKRKEMPTVNVDVEDRNFFMCSNDIETLPATVSKIIERQEEMQNHRPQTPLTIKPMPAKQPKFVLPKFKNIQPPTFNFSAIMDKARKVSKIRTNKLRQKVDNDKQNKIEETQKEHEAVSSLVKNMKTRRKRQTRRRKVEMPALSRYNRMPTLIDWVQYTGLLHTPSMQMQTMLNREKA